MAQETAELVEKVDDLLTRQSGTTSTLVLCYEQLQRLTELISQLVAAATAPAEPNPLPDLLKALIAAIESNTGEVHAMRRDLSRLMPAEQREAAHAE